MKKPLKIGVLALQGAFIEHLKILRQLGVSAVEVRLPNQLDGLDGLIIPGGESTTIGKLAVMYNFIGPLCEFAAVNPVWGTCAGMIFMAKKADLDQPLLGLMNIKVKRNAFGRQVDSFQVNLNISILNEGEEKPFPAIFIRAPEIIEVERDARVIAELSDGTAVAAQEGKLLVTAFHPELTDDDRFHRYFISLVAPERLPLGQNSD